MYKINIYYPTNTLIINNKSNNTTTKSPRSRKPTAIRTRGESKASTGRRAETDEWGKWKTHKGKGENHPGAYPRNVHDQSTPPSKNNRPGKCAPKGKDTTSREGLADTRAGSGAKNTDIARWAAQNRASTSHGGLVWFSELRSGTPYGGLDTHLLL